MQRLLPGNLSRFFLFVCIICWSCHSGKTNDKKDEVTTQVYYNGTILTMEGNQPGTVEAIGIQNGKIVFAGSLKDAKSKFLNTTMTDLQGNTMLPGFIDPHSHFGMVANAMGQVDLNPPPVGSVQTIEELLNKIKKYKQEHTIPDGEWIFGWGYDDGQLAEKRHPNKNEIDAVLPNNPVYLNHTSGHMGVANSLALRQMNVTVNTVNPAGGNIDRFPGTKEPNGLLQETATYAFMGNMLQQLNNRRAEFFDKTQEYYAQNGITTAQDGMTDRNSIAYYQSQADAGKLKIDLVSLAGFSDLDINLNDTALNWKTYKNGFKIQGTKIIADGSPQGKTAYFSKPYQTKVPGCQANCRGIPSISQETLNNLVVKAYAANNQLFIHCNGDASVDMVIEAHEKACTLLNLPMNKDRRTIVIHSQFVRPGQLTIYKNYNIEPSFFTNHAYFWGDEHVQNLGKERAFFLSPIATADSLGLHYTNHSDATVTPINPIFTVWSAVNRLSRSGIVIGANERATPYQALKAITIHAAYELFEEGMKGTIEVGKLADLVILDKNPLSVAWAELKNIQVVETIKNGRTIFKK